VRFDYCVIGAGIVGLATARRVLEMRNGASVLVLEKENRVAAHQTGHNSGVVHSGIYYEPGSLKARLCKAGARETELLAAEHGVPIERCGKLLVATDAREVARLDELIERATINGIAAERIDGAELSRREPAIRGRGALFVPQTGIVDYTRIAETLAASVRAAGGVIETGVAVTGIFESDGEVRMETSGGERRAGRLAVCAGLQADRVARMAGLELDFQIIPFRGEYYRLPAARNHLIQRLIYPVPDPTLPFLGIHLTRTVDGGVTVGPNAVLAMAREGYPRWSFDRRDVATYLRFPGTWRVAGSHARTAVREARNSVSKRGYLAACRRYCPELTTDDLLPEPAGIRAQAVLRDGTLVHDFLFGETPRTLHMCNAPSPAATSALPIGRHIARRLLAGVTP
jgi:(S)-2-hydroxyglutarate dehydrogenase